MMKPGKRLAWAGLFAALTAGVVALAYYLPDLFFSIYTGVSRLLLRVLGTVLAVCPVPVWEILLALAVLIALGFLVVAIRKHRLPGFLASVLECACGAALLFMLLWGLNHLAPPIEEQLGMKLEDYTVQDLQQAAVWYAKRAATLSKQVERNAEGKLVIPTISELSEEGKLAYELLGEENDRFANAVPAAKPLLASKLYGKMGISGLYLCLTGEACVSTETYGLSMPFTICHEMGHSLAVARENEANYLAFLACRASENKLFQYSGYYSAFLYCHNALQQQDSASAQALWEHCSAEMRRDSDLHTEHLKQFEGATKERAEKLNDSYLKLFSEEGIEAYGQVTDYLVAEYLKSK